MLELNCSPYLSNAYLLYCILASTTVSQLAATCLCLYLCKRHIPRKKKRKKKILPVSVCTYASAIYLAKKENASYDIRTHPPR
jgi:hypothetical protein